MTIEHFRLSITIKCALFSGVLYGLVMIALVHREMLVYEAMALYSLAILLCYAMMKAKLKTVSYKELTQACLLIVLVAVFIMFLNKAISVMMLAP